MIRGPEPLQNIAGGRPVGDLAWSGSRERKQVPTCTPSSERLRGLPQRQGASRDRQRLREHADRGRQFVTAVSPSMQKFQGTGAVVADGI